MRPAGLDCTNAPSTANCLLRLLCLSLPIAAASLRAADNSSPPAVPPIVARQQIVATNGLTVRVGETVQILPATATKCAYVGAEKLPNGDLVVCVPWPRTGQPAQSVRSSDGGRTWRPAVSRLSDDRGVTWHDGPTPICDNYLALADGSVIGFDFPRQPNALWTFNADGTTGVLRRTSLPAGEEASLFGYQHTMVQLADGRLLATSQIKRPKDLKSRVPIHVSDDHGLTWRFLSHAALDLAPHDRQEGFTEPRLLRLANGTLLCFLRTANPDTAKRSGYTYEGLEVVKSTDDGRTWSAPATVVPRGVYPDAVAMRNGVIAVSYGRPGNNVIFSIDGGGTWISNLRVADTIRAPDCGFYNSLIEVEPGTLLLVYSTGERTNKPSAIVLGTFLQVEGREIRK